MSTTATKFFLDKDGLVSLWKNIRTEISNKIATLSNTVNSTNGNYVDIELIQENGKVESIKVSDEGVLEAITTEMTKLNIETSGTHQHAYTPSGEVTISGTLNNGILSISASFIGTTGDVEESGSHEHDIIVKSNN